MRLPRLPDTVLPLLRQSLVTAGVSLNFIGSGCVVGYPTVLIPSLRKPDSSFQISTDDESWIASIIAVGLIIGNIVITPVMEMFGRKKAHLLTTIPQLAGWAILCLTTSITGIFIARLLQGLGMGLTASLGSILIGETSEPKYRGVLLSFVSLSLTIGNLVSHSLGTYFTWRQVALICLIMTIVLVILILFSPETPSWYIRQGKYEEGRKVFFWLRSQTDEQEIELEKIISAQKLVRKSSVDVEKLNACLKISRFFAYLNMAFHKPEFYKPVTIGILTYCMFQFAGINVLSSYTLDIINQLVGPDNTILMVVLDIERLVCNILAIFLMKVLKRRTFLFFCGIICIATYLAKAFYLYAKSAGIIPPSYDSQWIPICLLAIYVSVATGISSVAFAIPGEIMPLQYRGLGGGLSALIGISSTFFIAIKCFPLLTEAMGLSITYCLYGTIVMACQIALFYLMPETKDRTLQDIEDGFKKLNVVGG